MNKKSHHSTPTLTIGEGVIPQVKCTKCLGDMINEKGTNVDMIEDRIMKAKAAMTNCLSTCNEVTMGLFLLDRLPFYTGLFSWPLFSAIVRHGGT